MRLLLVQREQQRPRASLAKGMNRKRPGDRGLEASRFALGSKPHAPWPEGAPWQAV